MRLLIAAVGRLKQGPERDLFRHYLARTEMAGGKLGLAPVTVIEVPESRGPTAAARTAAEAMVMLGKVPPSHKLVCLDREGEALGSTEFAQAIGKFRDQGAPGLAFLVSPASCLPSSSTARRPSSPVTLIIAPEPPSGGGKD